MQWNYGITTWFKKRGKVVLYSVLFASSDADKKSVEMREYIGMCHKRDILSASDLSICMICSTLGVPHFAIYGA